MSGNVVRAITIECLDHGPMTRDEPRKWWICTAGDHLIITDEAVHRDWLDGVRSIPGVQIKIKE